MKKYEIGGHFQEQGISGFLLLNLEATIMIFVASIVTHLIIQVLSSCVFTVKPNSSEKDLSLITKAILKKKEGFLWDTLPRQLNIYMIQALIYSFLQIRCLYFDTVFDIINSVTTFVILLLFPVFIYWIIKAQVKPLKDQFITVKKSRGIFQLFKVK